VTDDGNLRIGEGADQLNARAFDLDGFGAGFFYKTHGVGQAFGDGAVIAAKRHVGHHQGAANGAADGAGVVEHFIHGDGQGVFVTEDDHGQRVANQKQVDASFVGKARGGVVVRGERGDGLALPLHFGKCRDGDFCDGDAGRRGALPGGKVGDAHVCLQCRSVNSGCGPNRFEYTPGCGKVETLGMNRAPINAVLAAAKALGFSFPAIRWLR
jgi:hypothetical protein